MAEFFVVFKEGPAESSDSNFVPGKEAVPSEGTKILGAIERASIVLVEATSQAKADEAARIAYPGRAGQTPKAVEKGANFA